MADFSSLTIAKARKMLDAQEITAEELRLHFLSEIKKENGDLNAYLSVFEEKPEKSLLYQADSLLQDIPGAIKDNILVKGAIATGGSKILENYVASYDATVIERLRLAGSYFLGKTNMDEFAMGSSGENSAYGPTKNPHDRSRVPGGSSSGSVAAVAGGLALYALGTDTGGSIREPAAYCGVVGLKPTYGRVSRHGAMAMASSLDQIGPITKTVEDSAIVLRAIAGQDPFDSTTSPHEVPDYTKVLGKSIEGLRIGVPKEFFGEGLDPRVGESVRNAIKVLQQLGAEIKEVSLPYTEYALATYYIIVPSEVSSNLARYDGIRYGLSVRDPQGDLLDTYLQSRAQGFGTEVRRRIMLGTYVLSAGYYDAYYLKAQKMRTLLKEDFDRVFKEVDVIVGPTTPHTAPKIGEVTDPLAMYLADIYTVPANLVGLPALSMPCGAVDIEGKKMPVGFQIMGKHFDEATILQVAHALEKKLNPLQ